MTSPYTGESASNHPTTGARGGASAVPTPANNTGGGSGWGDEGLKKGGGSGAEGVNLGGEGIGHHQVGRVFSEDACINYIPFSRSDMMLTLPFSDGRHPTLLHHSETSSDSRIRKGLPMTNLSTSFKRPVELSLLLRRRVNRPARARITVSRTISPAARRLCLGGVR